MSGQIHQREAVGDPAFDLTLGQAPARETEPDVFRDRHRVEQSRELEYVPDLPPQLGQFILAKLAHRLAVHLDLAGIGQDETHNVLERDTLPAPRVADDDGGFAIRNGKREALEDGLGAEGFVDVVELDHQRTGGPADLRTGGLKRVRPPCPS